MAKIAINEFARKAYAKYIAAGMTAEGACGLMGNQYAESAGFIANRMEFLLKSLLRIYSDATYTTAVDCGKISREGFLHPFPGKQYGYGLCQWTSPGRKAALYDLAKKRGVSIGDEDLAIDYTLMELEKSYPSTLEVLKSARTVKEASDYVLIHFESPADCGAAVKCTRADYAQQYYDYFKKTSSGAGSSGKKTAESYLDIMRKWIGYSEANGQFREIIDLYNSHRPLARGYAVKYTDEWCDTTVSAVAVKAGMVDLIGTECGVEEHVRIFRTKGIWNEDGTIAPKPGYIIVYSWRTSRQPNDAYSDHIGVVESVKNGLITAIEGNKDEEVGRRVIPVGWGYIRGYAMPKYDKAGTDTGNTAANTSGQKPAVDGADDGRISYKPQWVGKCTADMLNVRVWAGTGYPNIKSWPVLAEGNLVDVCDSVKGGDGQAWYFVRIAGQYFGFVHSAYIEKM